MPSRRPAPGPVFLTVDIDVLDPAFAPGTGTPEPGGMTTAELLWAVREVAMRLDVVGADMVEVIPTGVGSADITALAADRIVREILGGIALHRNGTSRTTEGGEMTETRTLQNFVGGEYAEPADGRTYDLVNPATGEVFSQAPLSERGGRRPGLPGGGAGLRDVARHHALGAADGHAQDRRRHRGAGGGDRACRVREHRQALRAHHGRGDPGRAWTRSGSSPGAARVLEGKSAGEYLEGYTSFIRREPIGVIGQVTPWNYPMMMAIWKFAPAIAAGNTIVIKPSDTTPVSTVMMAEIASEFLPEGVFNVVCGDRDTGRALVQHPTPQMVAITGSVRAGMQVAEAASYDLKRVHLELGGKAPVIIFDDADLEEAAEEIAGAGYFNAGQDCTAATRVLAAPRVYDDFVDALTEQARNTKTGDPDDEDTDYGPLNNSNQLAHVSGMVERLPDHAEVTVGGERFGDRGYFYSPTVVSGPRAGRRSLPERDLRPRHHRPALLRRGRGRPLGQRREVRPRLQRVHERSRPRDAGQPKAGLRVRLDQHAHPARGGDAARRLQALRLRQGPLDVRPGGLHPHQARDEQPRGLSMPDTGQHGGRRASPAPGRPAGEE